MNETALFVMRHGYALLFVWILAEQGALPLPSVPLLLVCGALAKSGHLQWSLVLLSGITACLIADSIWFQLGRSYGSRILSFLCRVSLEPDTCIKQTEAGFVRYGLRFLLISKFVPGMNAVSGPLAGSSGVGWRRFLLYDAAGSAIWIGSWGMVGYLFGQELEQIGAVVARTGFRLLLSIVVLLTAWILWKYIQRIRFLKKVEAARITPDELREMLAAGEDVLVIDVRSHDAEDDLIPGALRIPSSDLATRHQEIARDRDIILFCA